jgi:hypothetical protein
VLSASIIRVMTMMMETASSLKRRETSTRLHGAEELAASIIRMMALMMEAASTSKTSVNAYQTTHRNNPEDSHLHTRRREKLKSHREKISSEEGGCCIML